MNSHTDIIDSDRTCVLVLGMHRSGTSALTRVLNLLGAALPGDLLEANEWNESGYWEPHKLVSLNEHMLREAGSSWNDWRPFTPSALGENRLEHYRNEIKKEIIEDYGDATLSVLKDPRISRFTPLYIEILTNLGIAPRFVIMYRNPLGVIGSLSQRDQMTPGFASLMWLQHQLAAERATRGFPRTFLSYANLVEDWRGSVKRITTELEMAWPRSIESASSEIDSFISPGPQHHNQQPKLLSVDTTIPQTVKDSYAVFQSLERSGPEDSQVLHTLDRSYQEFESYAAAFADALQDENQRSNALNQELSDRVADLANRVSALKGNVADLTSETERLTGRVSELDNQKATLRDYGERLVAQRRDLEMKVLELEETTSPERTQPELETLPGMSDLTPAQRAEVRDAFDEDFYLKKYLDVAASGIDPFEHFLQYGSKEGRNPTPNFSTNYYRSWAPDLEPDTNPFIHWVTEGRYSERYTVLPGTEELTEQQLTELRNTFDANFYLSEYAEIEAAGLDPFEHFMRHGWEEGRNPAPDFSTNYYRSWAPDLAPDTNPFVHWITEGRHNEEYTTLPGTEELSEEQMTELRDAFDPDFYLTEYPDIKASSIDPFEHFMRHGWEEGRNPSADFSTNYYRRWASDLPPDLNPLVHWVTDGSHQGRLTLPFHDRLDRISYNPKVSAIVPNYNHAQYLEQRIDSILAQTYDNLEILILDDCSQDDSRAIISRYCDEDPAQVRAIFNEQNSGSVFRQWRKGVGNTDGDLVWICESDDFCEPDFLENLVPHFRDRSVSLAFGRIQFATEDGAFQPGLDGYREGAEPGIWDEPLTRPAHEWFTKGFGVNNVISNVGGCLWRRQTLPDHVWEEAERYTVVGDWYLYAVIAGGGQIAWEPSAVSHFRQHAANTSVNEFIKPDYYREHERLISFLRRQWSVPRETVERFHEKVSAQYAHFGVAREYGPLSEYFSLQKVLRETQTQHHILLAFLGFHDGDSEAFAIELANELQGQEHLVSMLALEVRDVDKQMLVRLNSGIPVYDAGWVAEYGVDRFIVNAGISLIHSHSMSADRFFFSTTGIATKVPYLISPHGAYDASAVPDMLIEQISEYGTHWTFDNSTYFAALEDGAPAHLSESAHNVNADHQSDDVKRLAKKYGALYRTLLPQQSQQSPLKSDSR